MLLKTLLLFSFGLWLHLAAAGCDTLRTISIRLINDAAVNPRVIIAVRQEAAYVLKSLCVQVEWTASPSTQALEMRIIVEPLSAGITDHALGITVLDALRGNRGAVFFARVRAMEKPYASRIGLGNTARLRTSP